MCCQIPNKSLLNEMAPPVIRACPTASGVSQNTGVPNRLGGTALMGSALRLSGPSPADFAETWNWQVHYQVL
jgi:hypothetical protein